MALTPEERLARFVRLLQLVKQVEGNGGDPQAWAELSVYAAIMSYLAEQAREAE